MNILVTGSAGFIGAAISKKLCEKGDQITGMDNISPYYKTKLKEDRLSSSLGYRNYRFHVIDINDLEGLKALFKTEKFDSVFHLAAQPGVRHSTDYPEDTFKQNINGFFNILECCKEFKVNKLVYASSSSVYGDEGSNYKAADKPLSLYAATKRCNEILAHSYHHQYGINCIGLRFYTVYGEFCRPDMAINQFLDLIYKNKPINLYNNGENKRDYSYINDVVNASILAHDSLEGCKVLDIGKGSNTTTNELLLLLEKHANKQAIKKNCDRVIGDAVITQADTREVSKIYPLDQWTSLDDGLANTVKWYKEYYFKLG